MPYSAPVHRHDGYKTPEQRKAESDKSREHTRLRGRRRQQRNRLILMDNPLCVMCEAKGITRLATEVDHIVPLFKGGTEEESNLQGLCHDHHVEKTTQERR